MNQDYQKWLTKLLGFDFNIEYKASLKNKATNALSRMDATAALMALSIPHTFEVAATRGAIETDKELSRVLNSLRQGHTQFPGYSLLRNNLMYKDKLVLPRDSTFVQMALQEGHGSNIGGHGGFLKTYQTIAGTYWKGMRKDIRAYIAACDVCQQQKYSLLAPMGLLQPLLVPDKVWEDISMDFVERLPKSEGFDSILVVEDSLSKYAHFISLKHPFSTPPIAAIFAE